MTVALVANVESIRTLTTDPYTFSYAGGTPKGIAIGVVHAGAAPLVTSVTYGGVAMTRVEEALDQAVEPGSAQIWFLGSGVPTGTQTVSADLTSASGTDVAFFLWELSGVGDLTVIDFEHINDDATNPTVVMKSAQSAKISLCALYTGTDAPGGTLAAGNTASQDHDFGTTSAQSCHETTVDNLDHTIGWSTLAADDCALAAIAVAEVADAPGYLLRTTANALVSTPDHASLDIVGDLDLRALVLPDDTWNHANNRYLVAKWDSASTADKSYALNLTRSGGINFISITWKEAAGTDRTATSTVSVGAIGGATWVRATLDVDNGASQYDAKFYTSGDDILTRPELVTWVQLGATVTGTTGVTTVFSSISPLEIGSYDTGTTFKFHGKMFYAEVRSGIAGTIVANPDFRSDCQKDSATQLTDDTGKVWTIGSPATWPVSRPCFPATRSKMVKQRRFATHMAM